MKTKLITRFFTLFALASMVMISCTKDPAGDYLSYVPPATPPGTPTAGKITDNGPLTPDLRLMRTDLTTQFYVLTGPDVEKPGADSRITAAFYVDSDGIIPSGEYLYSDSGEKSPFTFDSGSILGMFETDSYGYPVEVLHQIVSGRVIVSQSTDDYTFEFQVQLTSGLSFNGTYTGKMSYEDAY